ncbi:1,2-dihydroxy-3-keto-5-methylthiopentene dioxygenase, partial [Perkinsus olseni]
MSDDVVGRIVRGTGGEEGPPNDAIPTPDYEIFLEEKRLYHLGCIDDGDLLLGEDAVEEEEDDTIIIGKEDAEDDDDVVVVVVVVVVKDIPVDWLGYADDLHISGGTVQNVEFFLQELQAAAYYAGLRVNTEKTVAMVKGFANKVTVQKEVREERVAVKWDDGKYEGWLRPLEEEGDRFSHKIIYDDGTVIKCIVKKAGWIEDED